MIPWSARSSVTSVAPRFDGALAQETRETALL
jgi:hypothetical protein